MELLKSPSELPDSYKIGFCSALTKDIKDFNEEWKKYRLWYLQEVWDMKVVQIWGRETSRPMKKLSLPHGIPWGIIQMSDFMFQPKKTSLKVKRTKDIETLI